MLPARLGNTDHFILPFSPRLFGQMAGNDRQPAQCTPRNKGAINRYDMPRLSEETGFRGSSCTLSRPLPCLNVDPIQSRPPSSFAAHTPPKKKSPPLPACHQPPLIPARGSLRHQMCWLLDICLLARQTTRKESIIAQVVSLPGKIPQTRINRNRRFWGDRQVFQVAQYRGCYDPHRQASIDKRLAG